MERNFRAALKHGIRKWNHGNGNRNRIWERGIQEINFKISNNNDDDDDGDDDDDDDDDDDT